MFHGSTGFRQIFAVTVPTVDMSLQKNQAGQNFTFALVNPTNDLAFTGATISGFISKDGGGQVAAAGSFVELGHGAYNYAPTQSETNANCVSFLIRSNVGATNGVPENIMFLTAGGLHKNVAAQHVTFVMYNTAGAADTAASVTVYVSRDGGTQTVGAGVVTNLGSGQYDYAPVIGETSGNVVSFLFTAANDVIQNLSVFTVTP